MRDLPGVAGQSICCVVPNGRFLRFVAGVMMFLGGLWLGKRLVLGVVLTALVESLSFVDVVVVFRMRQDVNGILLARRGQ